MRRRKVRSRRPKTAIKAMLTLNVARLQHELDQMGLSNNRSGGGTHRRRKQTMNQAAKKIPIALASWPGASA